MKAPLIKWAGGKRQLLEELNVRLPLRWNTYFEPFVGGGALLVTLGEIAGDTTASDADELLALDTALEELAQLNPRQAWMVEARFFGGLDAPETAALLGVSVATLLRDWRAARAWLSRKLRRV